MNGYQDNSSRKNACRSGMPLMSCPVAGISGNRCINTAPPTCPPEIPCAGSVHPVSENGAFCPPVGMGYVPIQSWQQPYALETAFRRGTIFPDLDLPFMMGGAC